MLDDHSILLVRKLFSERFFERRLADTVVIYDSLSGDTHWLDELGTRVLDALHHNPLQTYRELLHYLNETYPDDQEEQLNLLPASIDSLLKIEIIQTSHC